MDWYFDNTDAIFADPQSTDFCRLSEFLSVESPMFKRGFAIVGVSWIML